MNFFTASSNSSKDEDSSLDTLCSCNLLSYYGLCSRLFLRVLNELQNCIKETTLSAPMKIDLDYSWKSLVLNDKFLLNFNYIAKLINSINQISGNFENSITARRSAVGTRRTEYNQSILSFIPR